MPLALPPPGLRVVLDLSHLPGLLLAAARVLVRIRMPPARCFATPVATDKVAQGKGTHEEPAADKPGKKRGRPSDTLPWTQIRSATKAKCPGSCRGMLVGSASRSVRLSSRTMSKSVRCDDSEDPTSSKEEEEGGSDYEPSPGVEEEDENDFVTRASPAKKERRAENMSASALSRQNTIADDADGNEDKVGVGEHGPVIVASWREPSVANEYCNRLLAAITSAPRTPRAGATARAAARAEIACGMDCEWCPVWWQKEGGGGDVIQLLQLYAPCVGCLVYSTGGGTCPKPLPEGIAALLADPRVVKCGVNIEGDARRLADDFGVEIASLHDPRMGAGKSVKSVSLEQLAQRLCPPSLQLDKSAAASKVRTGDWSVWPLSHTQCHYAALDAVVSYWVFAYSRDKKCGTPGYDHSSLIHDTPLHLEALVSPCQPTRAPSEAAASTPVTEEKKKGKKPSMRGAASAVVFSNFFVMHRNKSIVPPNRNIKVAPKGPEDALTGYHIIVSGVLDSMERDEFYDYVRAHGATVSKNVTGKLTHLVNDHGEVGPSKKAKCEQLGIKIVGEDFFLDLVRAAAS